MTPYYALIRKEDGSSYGVDFPDFPGCITAADTMEEAVQRASSVLAFHVEGMIDDGEAIPEPRTLDIIMAEPENRGAVPVVVPMNVARGKTVRVNVTLDENLLARIDAYAAARHSSRSAFLSEAARKAIQQGL
jgi:predicted RNase H-like HicB family nuclease